MKRFFSLVRQRRSPRGFSLVESVVSLGIISFGFLALVPLLALGLKAAQTARGDCTTSQIAETMNGNICRCGCYTRIADAIRVAANEGANA